MIKTTAFALPFLAIGTFTSAQGVEYLSYGASYIDLSSGDENFGLFSFGGSMDYRSNDVVLNGGLNYTDIDGEIDVTNLSVRGGYFVSANAVVYTGIDYIDVEGEDLTVYNLGGEFMVDAFTFGLNFEEPDIDGADTITTAYGSYFINPNLEVALAVSDDGTDTVTTVGLDYDMGDTDFVAVYSTFEGVDILALGGTYDRGNGFRAGGGYIDLDGEVDLLSVSGGYEVSNDIWVDVSYGQIGADGVPETIDVIGIALSFETGRETLLVDRAATAQVQALGALGTVVQAGGF